MTSEKEKLEELLDSIKPEENRLTTNNNSKDERWNGTSPEDEEKGIPSTADPEPAKTLEELDHPFYTDDSDPFSDEKCSDSVDRMTDDPFSSDDSVQQSHGGQTETRSRSQGQHRQQPANQQGGIFIYNPQIEVNGGRQQQKQIDLNELNRRIMEGK